MGNSNGTLAEYWDAIESTPGLQGGFIWEFWDHGLVQRLPDGPQRWAYGGDFGDEPNDGNFCADGLVWPDRRPKPAMWEHRAIAARSGCPGVARLAGRASSRSSNRQHFPGLGWLTRRLGAGGRRRDASAAARSTLPALGPGEHGPALLPRLDRVRRSTGFRGLAHCPLPDHGRAGLGAARGSRVAAAAARGRRRPELRSAAPSPTGVGSRRTGGGRAGGRARRRRPTRPRPARGAADAGAVARTDGQRPVRRHRGRLGGRRPRSVRAAARRDRTRRRHDRRSQQVRGPRWGRRPTRGGSIACPAAGSPSTRR